MGWVLFQGWALFHETDISIALSWTQSVNARAEQSVMLSVKDG